MSQVTLHHHKSTVPSLQDAVIEGLSQVVKTIPPMFFYDKRGSALFDQICEQPEYYLPTIETRLLKQVAREVAELAGTGRLLIEPGAGSLVKARLLLDELQPSAFVPMDISCAHLKSAATRLAEEYPQLPIHAVCVDFTLSLPIPDQAPDAPRLLFFPGSSLGNFQRQAAAEFLRMIRATLDDDGMLLIGVDTKKEKAILDAAYNDAAGITSKFNLNLLHRMRRELDTDLDPEAFEHRAFYNSKAGRIEMYLVSKYRQTLRINGHRFNFEPGESVHTENSYKYAPNEFIDMASDQGFVPVCHWLDDDGLFAVYLLRTD